MSDNFTMRLSQVARILNVGITTVVDGLKEIGMQVEVNPNVKIEADQVKSLSDKFNSLELRHAYELRLMAKDHNVDEHELYQITIGRIVREKIENCLALNKNSIDLSGLSLDHVPPEIIHITGLRSLKIAKNRIKVINNLPSKLIELDISNNEIATVSRTQLPLGLQVLKINNNLISEIEYLPNSLSSIEIRENRLTRLEHLPKNIKKIVVDGNQISDLVIPSKLAILSITNNNIQSLPNLPSTLNELYLFGNPLENIPEHILGSNEKRNCLKALTSYLNELNRKSEQNTDVKVILLGNSNVGKTSILSALKGNSFSSSQESTHGISIDRLHIEDINNPVKIQVWDLGGQEIYYGTHRIFMMSPSVQLLIFDSDTENESVSPDRFNDNEITRNLRLPFYLKRVQELSPESKIILVQNKVDSTASIPAHLREYIMEYPLVRVSAKEGQYTRTLLAFIGDTARQLKVYGRPVPFFWEKVKKNLVNIREGLFQQSKRVIQKEEFLGICRKEGVLMDGADELLTHLNDMGEVYYTQHLDDDIILDIKWALTAVYKIFDKRSQFYREIIDLNGKCTARTLFDDLDSGDFQYSVEEKWLFVRFMNSCGLCFPLKALPGDPETVYTNYVFPEFLANERPREVRLWLAGKDKLIYTSKYEFIPYYPLHIFITRFGAKTKFDCFWRKGILIYPDEQELYGFCIEVDFEANTLTLTIDEVLVEQWLAAIIDELSVFGDLNKQNRQWLRQFDFNTDVSLSMGGEVVERRELADLQNVDQPLAKSEIVPTRKKIVVSYAKEDLDVLTCFEKHILIHSKYIDFWYDSHLSNRGPWQDELPRQFGDADGYIIFVSPNYMNPSKTFIHQTELPIMEEKLKNGYFVIQIIIKPYTAPKAGHNPLELIPIYNKGKVLPDLKAFEYDADAYISEFVSNELLKKFI